MKDIDLNKTWIGIVIGIVSPILVYALYYFLVYDTGIKTMNVSICVAANLIPFYLYNKTEKYEGSKGVLISTLAWTALIVYFSLFTNHLRIG